jgi:hypothetical protein
MHSQLSPHSDFALKFSFFCFDLLRWLFISPHLSASSYRATSPTTILIPARLTCRWLPFGYYLFTFASHDYSHRSPDVRYRGLELRDISLFSQLHRPGRFIFFSFERRILLSRVKAPRLQNWELICCSSLLRADSINYYYYLVRDVIALPRTLIAERATAKWRSHFWHTLAGFRGFEFYFNIDFSISLMLILNTYIIEFECLRLL